MTHGATMNVAGPADALSVDRSEPVAGERIERPATARRPSLNPVTIAALAIPLAYLDGFWITSLQGVVGSFERAEPPFMRWLRDATLMLPLFVIATMLAVVTARRWVGRYRGLVVSALATGVFVVIATAALGTAEMALSSAWDYRIQTSSAVIDTPIDSAIDDSPHGDHTVAHGCDASCAARATFDVHAKAVRLAGVALLISNLVVVAWVLFLRGDRLWHEVPVPSDRAVDTSGRAAGTDGFRRRLFPLPNSVGHRRR